MRMDAKRRALDKIFKRRDRYEIPDWQRGKVWPPEKGELLIDTILRGWNLPKFYFSRLSDNPEQFEVVDGQQRLVAIFLFYENRLTLSDETAERFGGSTYGDLPDSVVDAFDDYEIQYDEITDATDEELKEFFERLQAGLQLTASEKLNAVHSSLTNFARDLSDHSFFANKVWTKNTRKAYFDIVSKTAAIQVDGIDTGLRYDDLRATFEAQANFSPHSNVATSLRATFDFLNQVFPEKDPILRNRSVVQSFATLAAVIVNSGHSAGSEKRLREFYEHFAGQLSHQVELGHKATDQDYLAFQRTLSANVRVGARIRHEILLRKLLLFDASFAEMLGAESVTASGIESDIRRLGDSVASLVKSVNERYSAENGQDLFKATNRTAGALSNLGTAIKDFDSYKALIDDLYFIFREGIGNRLEGRLPDSFVDANDLRTGLRHDVDHGNSSGVAKKRKRLGNAFRKYSGAASPTALAPERFPVVQANILRDLEADLKALTW